MGKRKSRRKAPTKIKQKLDSEFDCPFCCALKSVGVHIRRKDCIAILSCRMCNISYETDCSPVDEPIDVFSNWIDSCDAVNAPAHASQEADPAGIHLALSAAARPVDYAASRAANIKRRPDSSAVIDRNVKKHRSAANGRQSEKQNNGEFDEEFDEDEEEGHFSVEEDVDEAEAFDDEDQFDGEEIELETVQPAQPVTNAARLQSAWADSDEE